MAHISRKSEFHLEIGYVYIMTNIHLPGIIKIGMTTRKPDDRAVEISKTGVPGKWQVNYSIFVPDCYKVEKSVHKSLSKHRLDINREFFNVDIDCAIEVINEHSANLIAHFIGWPNIDDVTAYIREELAKIKEEDKRRLLKIKLEKQIWLVKLEQDKREAEHQLIEEKLRNQNEHLERVDHQTKYIINESYIDGTLLISAILGIISLHKSESDDNFLIFFWISIVSIFIFLYIKRKDKLNAIAIRKSEGLPEL